MVDFMTQPFSSEEKFSCAYLMGNIIQTIDSWDVTSFSLIGGYQRLEEIY